MSSDTMWAFLMTKLQINDSRDSEPFDKAYSIFCSLIPCISLGDLKRFPYLQGFLFNKIELIEVLSSVFKIANTAVIVQFIQ